MGKKPRKPRNFKIEIKPGDNYEIECGYQRGGLVYLKPDRNTYIWISHKKLKRWLDSATKYLEYK
jgi:hypothetical protein